MQIITSNFKHGKGIWKFNNSLLKNPEYLTLINKVIEEEKFRYALPVYSFEYIKAGDIAFTIDDATFLETLFLKIRG